MFLLGGLGVPGGLVKLKQHGMMPGAEPGRRVWARRIFSVTSPIGPDAPRGSRGSRCTVLRTPADSRMVRPGVTFESRSPTASLRWTT